MSEIRDRVNKKIAIIIVKIIKADRDGRQTEVDAVDQILSIKELAIVDREARFGNVCQGQGIKEMACREQLLEMLKAGWVKEVKE